jgi:rubrerythrin
MAPQGFTLLEAVEIAVAMEEEGIRFYSLAAERASDPEVKIMSVFLRDVEYEHIEYFRGLVAFLAGRKGSESLVLDPAVEAYFRSQAEAAVFPVKGDADRTLEGIKDVCDVLRIGIKAEKDSILYYRDLVEQTTYPEAVAAIRKIISEEKQHLLMLSGLLRRLASTESCGTVH